MALTKKFEAAGRRSLQHPNHDEPYSFLGDKNLIQHPSEILKMECIGFIFAEAISD